MTTSFEQREGFFREIRCFYCGEYHNVENRIWKESGGADGESIWNTFQLELCISCYSLTENKKFQSELTEWGDAVDIIFHCITREIANAKLKYQVKDFLVRKRSLYLA